MDDKVEVSLGLVIIALEGLASDVERSWEMSSSCYENPR